MLCGRLALPPYDTNPLYKLNYGLLAKLHCNEDATRNHYSSTKETLTYIAFVEKKLCPQDRQNSTQLKERCYVAYQAESNGGKSKERCNSRDECSYHERSRMPAQFTPCSPGR